MHDRMTRRAYRREQIDLSEDVIAEKSERKCRETYTNSRSCLLGTAVPAQVLQGVDEQHGEHNAGTAERLLTNISRKGFGAFQLSSFESL